MINYHYSDSISKWRNLGIELYKTNNQKLKRVSNNQRKTIPPKGSLEYVYYTRHFLDSSKLIQQQFKPYINRMLLENKDTLHIGTLNQFKKHHKELFEELTKNDSISIRISDDKKSVNRKIFPVEY
ncbi:hypothetical protein [Bizionia paragorgiae]|uniref:hypothetical protein n=2 Tax=Bizionia paragorgiae TaxID=283786 RepID=UPI003A9543E6